MKFQSVLPTLFSLSLAWTLGVPAGAQSSLPSTQPSPYEVACEKMIKTKVPNSTKAEGERLHKFFAFDFKHVLEVYPEEANSVGVYDYNDRWTDLSPEAVALRRRELSCPVHFLATVRRESLSPADQLNYDVAVYQSEMAVKMAAFPLELRQAMQVDLSDAVVPGTPYLTAVSTLMNMPTQNEHDYRNILARLLKLPTLLAQSETLLREGLRQKVVAPRVLVISVPGQIANLMPAKPQESYLYTPFRQINGEIVPDVAEKIKAQAEVFIKEKVYPALAKYKEFIEKEYLPKAGDQIALEVQPNGKAWYSQMVSYHTTSSYTPDEIHKLGLSEVNRIGQEMQKIAAQAGFSGDIEKFKKSLRTDNKYYFKTREELVTAYQAIGKQVDAQLPKLFGRLPRNPYGIKPIAEYSERSQPAAFYEPGSYRGGRAGFFMVNTYDLNGRPKWEMDALLLHEAVPGHHLQLALGDELEGVPEFRRYAGFTAFIEGWGLYAESLGKELGLYQDAASQFGRLSFEMWRACRLVVDTGIHHLGWPREKAVEFMLSHSAKSRHDVEVEIDRYIAWPGQALAYKIGELTFQKLKAQAREKLGDKFDIRQFHDALLGGGALPLEIVERRLRERFNLVAGTPLVANDQSKE